MGSAARPANEELVAYLSVLAAGDQAATETLTGYLKSALATPPGGDLGDPSHSPVSGFYIATSAELFTANLVTPARFIRLEFVAGRSLTVTVPLPRVSRVVDEWMSDNLTVTVEIDAQGLTGSGFQSETPTLHPAAYTLTASPDAGDVAQLSAFSAALRSTMET